MEEGWGTVVRKPSAREQCNNQVSLGNMSPKKVESKDMRKREVPRQIDKQGQRPMNYYVIR
jgi:hypothetical protein